MSLALVVWAADDGTTASGRPSRGTPGMPGDGKGAWGWGDGK